MYVYEIVFVYVYIYICVGRVDFGVGSRQLRSSRDLRAHDTYASFRCLLWEALFGRLNPGVSSLRLQGFRVQCGAP